MTQQLNGVTRFLRSNRRRIRRARRRMAQGQRLRRLEPVPQWYGLEQLEDRTLLNAMLASMFVPGVDFEVKDGKANFFVPVGANFQIVITLEDVEAYDFDGDFLGFAGAFTADAGVSLTGFTNGANFLPGGNQNPSSVLGSGSTHDLVVLGTLIAVVDVQGEYEVEAELAGETDFGVGVIEIPPICVSTLDWGDAPDRGLNETFGAAALFFDYGTKADVNGPRHIVTEGVFLGQSVEADDDGQPDIEALGDDFFDGTGDEDGIEFLTDLVPGDQASIRSVTSTDGHLWGWLDTDGSGTFDHPGELIIDTDVVGGSADHTFTVDPAATQTYFARFRFTTDKTADLTPLGGGANGVPDGEVEDYALRDFGDAPDLGGAGNYQTVDISDGARHFVDPQVFLGEKIDPEDDGHESADAKGDDISDSEDDEDGVIFNGPLVAGLLSRATVTASVAGSLELWVDYNNDGDFTTVDPVTGGLVIDPSDHVTAGAPFALNGGVNVISWFSPHNLISGISFARFRFTSNQGFGSSGLPYGFEYDGEVEDYRVQLFDLLTDFGDAPVPYPTLLEDDGAMHLTTIADFYLGEKIDYETDGIPDIDALGDDEDDGVDSPSNDDPDEDGVTLPAFMVPGQATQINVFATVPPAVVDAKLDAWIDWNADGDWDDPGEQIFTNQIVVDGDNGLQVQPPADAALGQTYARFRLSSALSSAGDLQPTGFSDSGEVEDYQVNVESGRSIGDFVWHDLDGNGIQDDGEPGLDDVEVNLYLDRDGDMVPELDGDDSPALETTMTAGGGVYLFDGLAVGGYFVQFTATPGFVLALNDQGQDDTLDSDADQQTGLSPVITFGAGEHRLDVDAGLFEVASISGTKFEDQDGDGVKDQGEPGLSDWTIQLQDGNGQLITAATTDVSGDYGFNDLGPGTYRVREVQQTGWTQTTANPSDIVATSGDDVSGVDFGNGNFELALDVDGNSTPAALTDGLLIIRYLAGFRGQALISGAVAPDATRTTAEQIEAFLEEKMPAFSDVDDSGSAQALTDGLLIIRFLAGFTGAALAADATAGPRSDPADIVAFLDPFLAPQAQQGLAGPADDQTHDALAEMSSLLLQFDDSRSVRQGSAAIDHTQVGAARFAG